MQKKNYFLFFILAVILPFPATEVCEDVMIILLKIIFLLTKIKRLPLHMCIALLQAIPELGLLLIFHER